MPSSSIILEELQIRRAEPEEAQTLTDLTYRSKAYWGYPKEWLDLWTEELTVTPQKIKEGITYVAENQSTILGYWCRAAIQSEEPSYGMIFIEPQYIGQGIGFLLWQSVKKELIQRGISFITLEADPNALGFYLKLGGSVVGETKSKAVPGRVLPRIRIELT